MPRDLLAHPILSERYFFPRRHHVQDPFWVRSGTAELACVLRDPHPEAPTVVYFHGNGETVSDGLVSVLPALLGMGLNVLLASYRGYGASTGEPSMAALLEDVPAIIEALAQPPQRLVFFGRSVGSIPALAAAGRYPDAAGLILESAIADPLERILLRVRPEELGVTAAELRTEVVHRLDHPGILSRYQGPLLILHAGHDTLVGVHHARLLHAWASGPTRLRIFESGDHNTLLWLNETEYFEEIRSFVDSATRG